MASADHTSALREDLSCYVDDLRRMSIEGHPALQARADDNIVVEGIRGVVDLLWSELCGILLRGCHDAHRTRDMLEWAPIGNTSPHRMKEDYLESVASWSAQTDITEPSSTISSALGRGAVRHDYVQSAGRRMQVLRPHIPYSQSSFSFLGVAWLLAHSATADDGDLWKWAAQTGMALNELNMAMGPRHLGQLRDIRLWADDAASAAARLSGLCASAVADPGRLSSIDEELSGLASRFMTPIGGASGMSVGSPAADTADMSMPNGTWLLALPNPWSPVSRAYRLAQQTRRVCSSGDAGEASRHIDLMHAEALSARRIRKNVHDTADSIAAEWDHLLGSGRRRREPAA